MTRTRAAPRVRVGSVPGRTRCPACSMRTSWAPAGAAPRSAALHARGGMARRKSSEGTVGSPGMAGAFEGKRGLILGVANKRSIAWAIAKVLSDGGAKLAFTYQGERIEKGVRELASSVDSPLVT